MWPHQPMVFNYRKICSPSTGTIHIGLHRLPHEEKQTLPTNLQNVLILLNCHATFCHCVQSHSKLPVTIYNINIFVFAVALTDTQAKTPLKDCFHQHIPCLHCVKVLYSFINICVPYLLQMSIGYVMHYMFHQLSHI